MAKQFQEVKKELEQELTDIFNRPDNKRKHEKIEELENVCKEIKDQEALYAATASKEDYDSIFQIKEEIDRLNIKKEILSEIVERLRENIPDYTHDEILALCQKEQKYFRADIEEKLEEYLVLLTELQKKYDKITDTENEYIRFQKYISGKSPACPGYDHMYSYITHFATNQIEDNSETIRELNSVLKKN